MLMWVMSDRAIPRSYRMMQGFGVHTFRLVNAQGESRFVKFHWNPVLGTHSLDWDEAVKISGADPDFHRRDLWEAIEAGDYPEWELGVQIFTEEQAEKFSFDVLDATKIVPEELVPVQPVGRMVLNRNPDNFFAETEQVAFCTAHIVPGIDFTQRSAARRAHPLVRRHADLAPRRAELPRDPDQRADRAGAQQPARRHAPPGDPARPRRLRAELARRRLSVPGRHAAGFTSFPQPIRDDKVRGKPEKFAEHYTQATLFWNSQTDGREGAHHPRVPLRADQGADRRDARARGRAAGQRRRRAGARASPTASASTCRSRCRRRLQRSDKAGSRSARRRCRSSRGPATAASARGASRSSSPTASTARRPRRCTRGCSKPAPCRASSARASARCDTAQGEALEVEVTLETAPAVLYDAVVVPGRRGRREGARQTVGHAQRVHQGPVPPLQADPRHGGRQCPARGRRRLGEAAVGRARTPACSASRTAKPRRALREFIAAIAKHRHFAREMDPPLV